MYAEEGPPGGTLDLEAPGKDIYSGRSTSVTEKKKVFQETRKYPRRVR